MIERVFILKRTPIFRDVADEILASLVRYLEEDHVESGHVIFERGDVGKSMYVIASGRVRLHNGETEAAVLNAYDVFGELSVLTSEVRALTATAAQDTALLRLDQDIFYELMAGNPAISRSIIEVLVERLR